MSPPLKLIVMKFEYVSKNVSKNNFFPVLIKFYRSIFVYKPPFITWKNVGTYSYSYNIAAYFLKAKPRNVQFIVFQLVQKNLYSKILKYSKKSLKNKFFRGKIRMSKKLFRAFNLSQTFFLLYCVCFKQNKSKIYLEFVGQIAVW